MIKVKFLKDKKYSKNGWDNVEAKTGDVDELPKEIAESYIKGGICEAVEAPKKKEAPKKESKPAPKKSEEKAKESK